MSYDLMVLDKHRRFTDKNDFLEWYNKLTEWKDDIDYNDYRHTTPELQKWFLEIKDIIRPLNGEFAPVDEEIGNGEFQEGDYCIAKDAIYVAFAWTDAEKVYSIVSKLAKKHNVAFFDIPNNHIVYPDGYILSLAGTDKSLSISIFQRIKGLFGF